MHIKCPNRDDFIFIRRIVHVPLVYGQKPYGTCTRVIPLYHYNFIHTYTVVVYAYHMRMTAKAVNILEPVHKVYNAATRTIVHSRVITIVRCTILHTFV